MIFASYHSDTVAAAVCCILSSMSTVSRCDSWVENGVATIYRGKWRPESEYLVVCHAASVNGFLARRFGLQSFLPVR